MKKLFWIFPFAYMGLIWILSSHSSNAVVELPDSSIDRLMKESLHLVEFAILYLLFVLASKKTGDFSRRLSFIFALISALYGIVDEIHQSFIPSRDASIIDIVKDVIGVAFAYWWVMRRYK